MGHKPRRKRKHRQKSIARRPDRMSQAKVDSKAGFSDKRHAGCADTKSPPPGGVSEYPGNNSGANAPKRAQSEPKKETTENSAARPSALDKWTCRATVVIAIATAVYTFAAIWQLSVLKDQLNHMQKDSEASSNAWQKQLGIMQGQLTHIQDASHLEQRAWVGVRAGRFPSEEIPSSIGLEFSNTGQTPANDITIFGNVCIKPSNFEMKPYVVQYIEEAWHDAASRGSLAPNASFSMLFPMPNEMTDAGIKEIRAGRGIIYVFGKILYADIFGEAHDTLFCYRWYPTTKQLGAYHQCNYMR